MPEPRSVPSIVVAGDVCIDWVSIPTESVVPRAGERVPMNWQLLGGRRMIARRGGAWLTADLVEAAVGGAARVGKPGNVAELENIPPERIVHSMLTLAPFARDREGRKVAHWAVASHDGFVGPPEGQAPRILPVDAESDDAAASLVVLDDAGNGFRDAEGTWPAALAAEARPLVLHVLRRPLAAGALWKRLEASHLDRTIALLSADELRGEGVHVGRRLSWERTATDLVLALADDPGLEALRSCPFVVVRLGIEGALLVRCVGHRVAGAHLWYLADRTEGELLDGARGEMSGLGSAFAAALAAELASAAGEGKVDGAPIDGALRRGVGRGLAAMQALLEFAFGPCMDRGAVRLPVYPMRKVFEHPEWRPEPIHEVPVPPLPEARAAEKAAAFRAWRILDSKRTRPFAHLATEVARLGVRAAFGDVPVGRFGALATIDRAEIESYRSVANLLGEFLRDPRPPRPLCLAVFGPPGSGKSFGVNQVARVLSREIEKVEFNVSQWDDPSYLTDALHRVRDFALRGKVPLVFFDEFDSTVGGQRLGWLRYFLAPMQDGVFADGLQTHQIGKAIFVFAGGTAHTFREFRERAEGTAADAARTAKLPDFLSRLRGTVDVFGFDPPVDTNLIRRAIVLRAVLVGREPKLEDATGTVRIDDAVLRAFLHVPAYLHGARSLQAIVEMSRLVSQTSFDPSLLPPPRQLAVHVDGDAFLALVEQHRVLGAEIESLAREIHALYLREERAKGAQLGSRPALRPWEQLDELYRNSNREQAVNIPRLLAAAGCELVPAVEADPGLELPKDTIEPLARMEHDRWVEERRIKQPDHSLLVGWEELEESEKEKDRRTVRAIPGLLAKVGLGVKRLD